VAAAVTAMAGGLNFGVTVDPAGEVEDGYRYHSSRESVVILWNAHAARSPTRRAKGPMPSPFGITWVWLVQVFYMQRCRKQKDDNVFLSTKKMAAKLLDGHCICTEHHVPWNGLLCAHF